MLRDNCTGEGKLQKNFPKRNSINTFMEDHQSPCGSFLSHLPHQVQLVEVDTAVVVELEYLNVWLGMTRWELMKLLGQIKPRRWELLGKIKPRELKFQFLKSPLIRSMCNFTEK
ncbi:hypothetical protein HN51_043833 [Arachis hypogaea]